jgi:hypothetical protein
MHSGQTKVNLIRKWVTIFALNAGQSLDATAIGIYESMWITALADVSEPLLEQAFVRALRRVKFWPIKVADIREHIGRMEKANDESSAEMAWQQILDIRRTCYNPDIPQYLSRALSKLNERIRTAARAAGVFREHDTVESLHVWCRKRFVESFIAWGERERDEVFLPPGRVLNMVEDVAHGLLPQASLGDDER